MRISKQIFVTILLLCLFSMNTALNAQTVYAKVGTQPIGEADGIAVWINFEHPSESLIIGASPAKGLATFKLDGSLVEVVNFGKARGAGGVDVRYGFVLNGKKIPLVLTTHEKANTLRIYTIDPVTHLLKEISGEKIALKVSPYGCCLYHSKKSGKFYAFVTSREGLIEQLELYDNGNGKVDCKTVRSINIMPVPIDGESPKTEACVADDEYGRVYFSQENDCKIWRYGAEPQDGNKRNLMDMAKINDGDNVEGLAIYQDGKKDGYLLISIQGSWKYKIYTRDTNERLATFNAMTADSSGLIESHDCIEVVNMNLGPEFPNGFMVTQNANNACGRHFQVIPWQPIAKLFNLKINNRFNPYAENDIK